MKKVLKFITAMILAFLPGGIGIMFTPTQSSDVWYNALNKSVLTPDGWVFGVAWTILYALLGIALFLIMDNRKTPVGKTKSYVLFAVQMILNALWTYMYFGLHMIGAAFAVCIALLIVSIWMMRSFYAINRRAAYLIIPYILWLIFATYLNGATLFMN